jgi:uncharacterized repeat protein (TIGR03803 family)
MQPTLFMNRSTKTRVRNPFLLPILLAGLGSVLAGRSSAEAFKVLHAFTPGNANKDGFSPSAGLVLSGNTLYGTASGGGGGRGTVFAVNIDGTGFTTLHNFTNNSDGGIPVAGLILSNNTLYGTTEGGGSSDYGTVFAVTNDGTGFATLHSFTAPDPNNNFANADGAEPVAGLVLSGNTLYGTAEWGGSYGWGTVFAVNTDGTGFLPLHSFPDARSYNTEGAVPWASLILSGNTLYGTAEEGGTENCGTVFAISTDGTGFTVLHDFSTAGDGCAPQAGLVLSGNTLYGTTYSGTVFAVNTNGTGFTTLYRFTDLSTSPPYGNSDGFDLQAGLILSGNTLYGTASQGGSGGNGTVFALNTDGTGFMVLHNFAGPGNGTILSPTGTELDRRAGWCYRATRFMGRRTWAADGVMARSSASPSRRN